MTQRQIKVRKIYLAVAAFFIVNILLFILAFLYLDRQKHQTFYYVMNIEGHDAGIVKIDKFVTDEKIIYRTTSSMPFSPKFTGYKSRLDLDRKYRIDSYSKELQWDGPGQTFFIGRNKDALTFVSTFESKFLYADKINTPKNVFIFQESSPETYMPVIDNYDFKRGRSQGFNAITIFSPYLPPMNRYITFTSINDEFIKAGPRLIKTEHLLLKIRNYPKGDLWVSKHDKSLIMADIPHLKLKIKRVFVPETFEAKEVPAQDVRYISRDVEFPSNGITLSGTLTLSEKGLNHPAVLLLGGMGRQGRDYQGLFSSLAHHLSNSGYAVLRFDKRGAGKSSGDGYAVTGSDDTGDALAAIDFLASLPEVDKNRVAIAGHDEGGLYAINAASKDSRVSSLILMAPDIHPGSIYEPPFEDIRKMAAFYKLNEKYIETAIKAISDTCDKVKKSKRDWVTLLRNRCFLKRIREELEADPSPAIRNISVPVLILQGKDNEVFYKDYAPTIDKTLNESKSPRHSIVYFDYLGKFFGKRINDGKHRIHYSIEPEVADKMKDWLDKSFESATKPDGSKDGAAVAENL